MNKHWVIMGNYGNYGPALVCVLPLGCSHQEAGAILHRMTTAPTDVDRLIMKDTTELWLECVKTEDAWWLENCN